MDSERIIVCPFEQKLIKSLKKRAIVIDTNDPNLVRYISRELNKENKLHAIRLTLPFPLSDLIIKDDWRNIPLIIYSHEFGEFKSLVHQINALKQLNVSIFLDASKPFNFTGLQILSSLKIHSGLILDKDFGAWEEGLDLMHYALYNRTRHASIEPFNYIASNYNPKEFLDYNTVYFNNPDKFLHLNKFGKVALSSSDLAKGVFISQSLESLDLEGDTSCQGQMDKHHEIMLSMDECAFCPAYRICMGKHREGALKEEGCKRFYSETMVAVEFVQRTEGKKARYGSSNF